MIDIKFPEDQAEGTTSVISKWLKQPGDTVTAHEPVAEVETDKVVLEIAAPADGQLSEILKPEGSEVDAGDVLGRIGSAQDQPEKSQQEQAPQATNGVAAAAQTSAVSTTEVRSGPAVRRLIREHQIDVSLLNGSGKNNRITKKDVLQYLEQRQSQEVSKPAQPAVARSVPAIDYGASNVPSTTVPHSSMRKRIAAHMVDSLLHTAPHVTSVFEADMSAVIRHRNANKADFQRKGVKLTFTAYFVAAVVKAIETVPEVNSRFHEDHLEIFSDINVGIGTALGDKGLIVPVLHQAQHHNLMGIAARLQDMTDKARNSALKPADTQNGTFTISNHGVSGSLVATPIIINQPQSAILGVGKMQKRVMVQEVDGADTISIRPMCYVSLTIDHRVLDGFQTNTFLSVLVDTINNWDS